jgi:hypothetical protein
MEYAVSRKGIFRRKYRSKTKIFALLYACNCVFLQRPCPNGDLFLKKTFASVLYCIYSLVNVSM